MLKQLLTSSADCIILHFSEILATLMVCAGENANFLFYISQKYAATLGNITQLCGNTHMYVRDENYVTICGIVRNFMLFESNFVFVLFALMFWYLIIF